MIHTLAKATIYVEDVMQGKKFWVEKMEFVIRYEAAIGPGMVWLEVAAARESETSLVLYSRSLMKRQAIEAAHPSLIFSCEHIEEVHKKLIQKGVIVTDIENYPYGKMFTFYDQDHQPYLLREDAAASC